MTTLYRLLISELDPYDRSLVGGTKVETFDEDAFNEALKSVQEDVERDKRHCVSINKQNMQYPEFDYRYPSIKYTTEIIEVEDENNL